MCVCVCVEREQKRKKEEGGVPGGGIIEKLSGRPTPARLPTSPPLHSSIPPLSSLSPFAVLSWPLAHHRRVRGFLPQGAHGPGGTCSELSSVPRNLVGVTLPPRPGRQRTEGASQTVGDRRGQRGRVILPKEGHCLDKGSELRGS